MLLVGGTLMVGHAVTLGMQAFTNLSTPPDLFGPTGHLVALVGVLGLYPVLTDRTATLVRAASAVGALAIVSWAVMGVTRTLTVAGVVSGVSDVLPGVFFLIVFGSTILTYVLFGVATLRVGDRSWVVGLLVLAPGALILAALMASIIAQVTALTGVVIGSGLSVSMLVLGYRLRTWGRLADTPAPAGTVTAG